MLNGPAQQPGRSSVFTAGTGRPINATMAGDSNRDDYVYNDRLPGSARSAYIGPDT